MTNRKIIREAKKLGWEVLKINNNWRVNTGGYHYLASRRGLIQDIKREKKVRKWKASPEGIRFAEELEKAKNEMPPPPKPPKPALKLKELPR